MDMNDINKHSMIDAPSVPVANPEMKKKRTRSATKTRMAGHEGPGLHYKQVRTTIALLKHSTIFLEFSVEERAAFNEIARLNYDLSAAKSLALEHAFAKLDDEVMGRARDEFEFVRGRTSIRNHGACIASCALCGKGDSKDDGTNQDKLQYDFCLTNTQGGTDLWVGSNCILNFGLKVRGAATSEEARAILERNLRECMSIWKKEAWRNDNPEHARIAEHFAALERLCHDFRWYGRYGSMKGDILTLGQTQEGVFRRCQAAVQPMRNALRFYERADYLTDAKAVAWKEARRLLHSLQWLVAQLDAAQNKNGYEREHFLHQARIAREKLLAVRVQKRTPRPMPAA